VLARFEPNSSTLFNRAHWVLWLSNELSLLVTDPGLGIGLGLCTTPSKSTTANTTSDPAGEFQVLVVEGMDRMPLS
jgi:hypothetical protein